MDAVVFGNVTVLHVLLFVAGLIALTWVAGRVRRMFARPAADPNLQEVRCTSCGWQGRVSRIAGRCPRCNEPLGDRTAAER